MGKYQENLNAEFRERTEDIEELLFLMLQQIPVDKENGHWTRLWKRLTYRHRRPSAPGLGCILPGTFVKGPSEPELAPFEKLMERTAAACLDSQILGETQIFIDRNGTRCYVGDTVHSISSKWLVALLPGALLEGNDWILWRRKGK